MPNYYTLEGDAFKTQFVNLIQNSGVQRVDRAIDIIYQTPDDVILPYLEEALKRNPDGDPKKLAQAVSNAETRIFADFQAAPWDEVHHGRASLSSMRSVRYLQPDQRVIALNGIAEQIGGPIGNSRFNLRGNSASRGAHTSGSIPWKNADKVKYRDIYDLPSIPRDQSMHPMGTDAAKDPRGIVVPQTDSAPEFISKAVDSIKTQFNDTVTGRYSDLPRRIIVENMLIGAQRRRGDVSTSSPLIYGNDANPEDVKASKRWLALPENEQLRINMLKGSFHPDSPQGQRFLNIPRNAALADMYISQMYHAGIPVSPEQLGSAVKNHASGLIGGAAVGMMTDPELHNAVAKGDVVGAGTKLAGDAVVGGLIQHYAPAAIANPVGAALLAATPSGSQDMSRQRARLSLIDRIPPPVATNYHTLPNTKANLSRVPIPVATNRPKPMPTNPIVNEAKYWWNRAVNAITRKET